MEAISFTTGDIISIVFSAVFFVSVMVIFTREKMDYVAYCLFLAILACLIVHYVYGKTLDDFLAKIEYDAIIFIVSMQIILGIAEKHNIFQWIALKAIHFTKGDHKKFFFLICFMASFSSSLVSDITVGIIFVPLVIRACKILKIDATPYLFGLSFTINIGSLYTPFSSSENILISSAFDLDLFWFLKNFSLLYYPLVFITLFVLKKVFLDKVEPPEEVQKNILLDIMHPELVFIDKKKFKINSYALILVLVGFVVIPEAYLVAMIGAIVISLLNKSEFADNLKNVDWKVISFLIGMFLLIGTMEMNGTFTIISRGVRRILSDNILLASITVLFLISVLSGFLAQVPTAIVFITLLNNIYPEGPPTLIIMAFILGINIGSNFLPQGAACDLITLNLAKKNGVKGYNYHTLLVNGSKMTLFHIINSIIYLTIYAFILGVF